MRPPFLLLLRAPQDLRAHGCRSFLYTGIAYPTMNLGRMAR